ncbi:MAG TPA: hypothetical protein VF403_18505, partial [Kofleriaceae bacterium]
PKAAAPIAAPVQPTLIVVAAAEPAKPVIAPRAAHVEHHHEVAPAPAPAPMVAAPVVVVAAPLVAPVVVKPAAPPPPLMPLPVDERPAALEPSMVSEGLASVRANIVQLCGVEQELHGHVTFHVKIAPDGVVDSITAAPASLLGKCVIGQLQQVKFTVTQRGGAFEKTYVF